MNPAADARAKVKANHPEAVVVERGRNFIKHRLANHADGRQRFALDVAIGPLHYGPGNDQEIDTTLQPSVAPWDWEMTKAGFEVRALSRLDAGQVIEYRNGSEWVRFQPMALQYSNDLNQISQISMPQAVDAAVDDDTLTWMDGYGPGRSLSWQAQTARLAKLLTINAPTDLPAVDQFILDGGNPVLELNLIFAFSAGVTPYINGQPWGSGRNAGDRDTQGLVEFRDDQGNVLWWFNLPRSWDSNGREQIGTFRFKKQGNSLYVSHRVPLSFVQGAVYPLMVDTTVDEQVGASADDGYHVVDTHAVFPTSTLNALGSINSSNDGAGAWQRFTTVAIPNGDTIDVAYLTWNPSSTISAATCKAKIDADDSDNPAAPTTDGEYDAITRTTAVITWDPVPTFTVDVAINSPSIVSVIQELVDRGGWASGNAMVILSHDDDLLSTVSANRQWDAYDGETTLAPKLHIEFTAAVTVIPNRVYQIEQAVNRAATY